MPLISRCRISLTLENMSQVSTTVAAHYLCPLHAKGAVRVASDRTGQRIEVCWPSAATLELVFRLVQGCAASCAGIDSVFWSMLIIFAAEWCLCALLSQNSELFLVKNGLPLLWRSLVGVRHLF